MGRILTRRGWLTLGLLALLTTGVKRVTAAGPGQVDVEGYGGATSGSWACGPAATATYGGAGGNARIYTDGQPERDPQARSTRPPEGFSLGGGGGLESRGYDRRSCRDNPCGTRDAMPPATLLAAGHANAGYDANFLGVRLGAVVFPRWEKNTADSVTLAVVPELDVRIGARNGFHGGLGVGSYSVSTLFRPGAYAGLGYGSDAWSVDVRGGVHAVFDQDLGLRIDASTRYEIVRGIAPGIGVAASSGPVWLPEGRAFVSFTP